MVFNEIPQSSFSSTSICFSKLPSLRRFIMSWLIKTLSFILAVDNAWNLSQLYLKCVPSIGSYWQTTSSSLAWDADLAGVLYSDVWDIFGQSFFSHYLLRLFWANLSFFTLVSVSAIPFIEKSRQLCIPSLLSFGHWYFFRSPHVTHLWSYIILSRTNFKSL